MTLSKSQEDFERLILAKKFLVVTFAFLMDKQYKKANLKERV